MSKVCEANKTVFKLKKSKKKILMATRKSNKTVEKEAEEELRQSKGQTLFCADLLQTLEMPG
jgi:hypothetical protein